MSTATSPRPLASQLRKLAFVWSQSQQQLIGLSADFADSNEWALDGSPTPSHWLAAIADIEPCTAREWIRIGRLLRTLPATADAFTSGELSYSKVRALTRIATPANEAELVEIAHDVPAGELRVALATWLNKTTTPEQLAEHHHQQRSVKWRTEADGMVIFTLRLPPRLAGMLIALLTTLLMRSKPRNDASADYPTVAQQHADGLEQLLHSGTGTIDTEVIVHVRGDGNTLDDGTPIPDTIVESLAPTAFLRALIHDAERTPINASAARRHPTTQQKRVVRERDRHCVDCGRAELLEYDHNPAYETTGRTIIDELELRCAPCHHARHVDG